MHLVAPLGPHSMLARGPRCVTITVQEEERVSVTSFRGCELKWHLEHLSQFLGQHDHNFRWRRRPMRLKVKTFTKQPVGKSQQLVTHSSHR